MALKVKVNTEDQDNEVVDIPLFATVDDSVKDIELEDSTVVKVEVKIEK